MTKDSTPGAARTLASRQNGARSRGPATAAGKARPARNALRHGLRARQLVLPAGGEDPAAFRAFAAALHAELAPQGALQTELAARIALAAWRARRADRIEAALLARYMGAPEAGAGPGSDLGAALVRDGHGPRAIDTLLRYRGTTLAELWRALAALRALQAEDRDHAAAAEEPAVAATPPVARGVRNRTNPRDSLKSTT